MNQQINLSRTQPIASSTQSQKKASPTIFEQLQEAKKNNVTYKVQPMHVAFLCWPAGKWSGKRTPDGKSNVYNSAPPELLDKPLIFCGGFCWGVTSKATGTYLMNNTRAFRKPPDSTKDPLYLTSIVAAHAVADEVRKNIRSLKDASLWLAPDPHEAMRSVTLSFPCPTGDVAIGLDEIYDKGSSLWKKALMEKVYPIVYQYIGASCRTVGMKYRDELVGKLSHFVPNEHLESVLKYCIPAYQTTCAQFALDNLQKNLASDLVRNQIKDGLTKIIPEKVDHEDEYDIPF